jgi:hypothetical protein
MRTIEQLREDFINLKIQPIDWLGDSPNRFDTYAAYARRVDSIAEFGVYTGLSTTAFLSGKPKVMRSYDISNKHFSVLPELKVYANKNNIDFTFSLADSLKIDIEPVDLLFIDTIHEHKHTIQELNRHASKVKKYILLHDPSDWPGVFTAVVEFLTKCREWRIVEHCNKNSGFLVLERY